jgi:uncharacterized protein YlzI (FlbEa/FlbD family)
MIELIGLNGANILVAPKTIFRIRQTSDSSGNVATKVDYTSGYIFTLEPIRDLLARLRGEIKLINLTTRSGTTVHLNVASIARIREALPINAPGTEIVVGGQYQHVSESVEAVKALLA